MSQPAKSPNESRHWLITVTNYGSFIFVGTEEQAEEMRGHKARWEGGIGRKRLATEEEIEECTQP